LVAERWRPGFEAELESLVREEAAAKAQDDERVSIRLAGEFHIKLAELTDNGLLQRYLGEVVSRCSLILATFGRPHSSQCAIDEHHQIIDALGRRDQAAAIEVMDQHLGSVERRALLTEEWDQEPNLGALLSHYTAAAGAADFSNLKRGAGR
jgi:DNA-binding GntR family transcriptional regulator